MTRRLGLMLAVLAMLLQIGQPLFAAVRADRQSTAPAVTARAQQPCQSAAQRHQTPTPIPMQQGHGCCCFGAWSCGGPCGAAMLTTATPSLPATLETTGWLTPATPQTAAEHPRPQLKPPQRTL